MRICALCLLALIAPAIAAGSQTPEATSLLGRPLVSAAPSPEQAKKLEAELAAARAAYEASPGDADAIIWLGRRTAYLGRYRDAIAVFTEGIDKHPEDARMYRHRGHRYITVREFDKAIADLNRAAELVRGKPDQTEPDGQPNARNIPTSTLNSNIYYHLGLAHYLKGNFERALQAYRECLGFSKNPDMLTATSHWLYMTLRRLDRPGEARQVLEPISPEMDIIENTAYHRLLMLYKGQEEADALVGSTERGLNFVTVTYGVGNWHLYNGRTEPARALFKRVVEEAPSQWAAFGYIAAEAELARTQAR